MATAYPVRRSAAPSSRLIVLAAAAVALMGGGAWWLLREAPAEQRPGPAPRPPGTIAVPVAQRNLAKGTELEGAGLIRPMYLRPEQVPPDAILKPNQMIGRVTQVGLRRGEYFSESKLAPPGAPSGFSGLLRSGHRMVVMNMAPVGSVTRFLREGDVVDIVAYNAVTGGGRARVNLVQTGNSLQPGTAAPSLRTPATGAPAGEPGLALVAQAVRIVLPPPPPPNPATRNRRAPPPNQDAVLEVHEDDAATLQLAMAMGRPMQFVHRPFNDLSRVDPDEARLARMPRDPRQIEIIEGGQRRLLNASFDD